jgi:hypothetical protein
MTQVLFWFHVRYWFVGQKLNLYHEILVRTCYNRFTLRLAFCWDMRYKLMFLVFLQSAHSLLHRTRRIVCRCVSLRDTPIHRHLMPPWKCESLDGEQWISGLLPGQLSKYVKSLTSFSVSGSIASLGAFTWRKCASAHFHLNLPRLFCPGWGEEWKSRKYKEEKRGQERIKRKQQNSEEDI